MPAQEIQQSAAGVAVLAPRDVLKRITT